MQRGMYVRQDRLARHQSHVRQARTRSPVLHRARTAVQDCMEHRLGFQQQRVVVRVMLVDTAMCLA